MVLSQHQSLQRWLVVLLVLSSEIHHVSGIITTEAYDSDDRTYESTTLTNSNVSDSSEGSAGPVVEAIPLWSTVIDRAQLAVTVVGFVANFMTFLTLMRSGLEADFNPIILFVLRHQSLVDTLVCLTGSLLITLPPLWTTGVYGLDLLVCQLWHGQFIYWQLVFLSVYSLILVAVERFLAVCYPFKLQELTVRSASCWLVGIYILSLVCVSGSAIQTRLRQDGACVSEYLIGGETGALLRSIYAVSTWFTYFLVPAILFVFLYGRVIYTFHQRKASSQLATSRIIDNATKQLTKTAIVVTVIFIISLGVDVHYYSLGSLGFVEYKLGAPLQKISVLFSMFNSCANPFVYTLFLPVYRRQMVRTFCCCLQWRNRPRNRSSNDGAVAPSNTSLSTISHTPVDIA